MWASPKKWFEQTFAETMYLPGSMPERKKGLDISLKDSVDRKRFMTVSFYFTPRLAK